MKTLEQHTLIYDTDCPMCAMYTKAFIHMKMLDAQGRIPFQQQTFTSSTSLDIAKSKDHIALVNRQTGTVMYGIDSLIYILAFRFPWMRSIFQHAMVYALLQRLYAFISYNRKVILPHVGMYAPTACAPAFHIKYRLYYILFALFISSMILSTYAHTYFGEWLGASVVWWNWICMVELVWQYAVVRILNRQRRLDYIATMMTVSMLGSISLLPLLIWSVSSSVAIIYFAVIVCLMYIEHHRRCSILGYPFMVSLSWLCCRLLILLMMIL